MSDAEVNLREAVRLNPKYYVLWANLAEGLAAIEPRRADARRVFQRTVETARKTLETNPTDGYARIQAAVNLARLRDFNEALKEADRRKN